MVAPDGRWHPGIGDPDLLGWATVVGYFGAALLAYRALRLHQAAPPSRDRRLLLGFWAVVLCAMVLLGVNKQLDLQTWLTEIGRDLARSERWYERRQVFQVAFIGAISLMGLAGLLNAALMLRSVFWQVAGALLGLSFLVTFVLVRAASLHHIDTLLGYGIGYGGVRLNWVLELSGIALIAASALRQGRPKTTTTRRLSKSLIVMLLLAAVSGWGAFAYSMSSAQQQERAYLAEMSRVVADRDKMNAELNQVRVEAERNRLALERAQADPVTARARLQERPPQTSLPQIPTRAPVRASPITKQIR